MPNWLKKNGENPKSVGDQELHDGSRQKETQSCTTVVDMKQVYNNDEEYYHNRSNSISRWYVCIFIHFKRD